jgi:hypothetical protein
MPRRPNVTHYDPETQDWLRRVLAGGAIPDLTRTKDPELQHDVARMRGVLPALSCAYCESPSRQLATEINTLLKSVEIYSDARPHIGWDTTTIALRLISILETYEQFAEAGLPWPGDAEWLKAFLSRHIAGLRVGNVLEPEGNHRIINIAGEASLKLLLTNERLSSRGITRFAAALERQWLADGGHVERSPHYHAQVLSLVGLICRADKRRGGMLQTVLKTDLQAPLTALPALINPNESPLRFSDAGRTFSGRMPEADVSLIFATFDRARTAPSMPDFGIYQRSWDGAEHSFRLYADCGPTGDALNSGHGHADALSFCLFIDGNEVFCDPGTYLYDNSSEARWFKLASAHNTADWPGYPSHELASFFRWRRLPSSPVVEPRVSKQRNSPLDAVQQWQVGHRRFAHVRTWLPRPNGLTIIDRLACNKPEPAQIRLNLPVGSRVTVRHHEANVRTPTLDLRIVFDSLQKGALRIDQGALAPAYGLALSNESLLWCVPTTMPEIQLETRIEVSS